MDADHATWARLGSRQSQQQKGEGTAALALVLSQAPQTSPLSLSQPRSLQLAPHWGQSRRPQGDALSVSCDRDLLSTYCTLDAALDSGDALANSTDGSLYPAALAALKTKTIRKNGTECRLDEGAPG